MVLVSPVVGLAVDVNVDLSVVSVVTAFDVDVDSGVFVFFGWASVAGEGSAGVQL